MNELIKVTIDQNNKQVVSARDLHKFLDASERFNNWFDRYLQYGFTQNEDFTSVKHLTVVNNGGKLELDDFAITINMAKELAMLQRSEKGKQARMYFIECENKLKQLSPTFQIPQTYAAALLEAGRLAEELDKANIKLLEQAPKVEFFEQVTSSKDAVDIGTVAKTLNLGYGRTTLFKKLREANILNKQNIPLQIYIDRGYFRVVESSWLDKNGDRHIHFKTIVYQSGINFIYNKFKN